jgi:hypothetical protein
MLGWVVNALFGCRHRKTSFPMTLSVNDPDESATFVVCLDCGKRLKYDWEHMVPGRPFKSSPSGTEKTPRK